MVDINKVADAFLNLFNVVDTDGNRRYDTNETTAMDRSLYNLLDSYNNVDGFARNDVLKFLQENTVEGISQFYPYFKFKYDEKCNDIWVTYNRAEIFPLNSGDIDPADGSVQSILRENNLPLDLFGYEARITYSSFTKGAPTILILEDIHEDYRSGSFRMQIVQRLLESMSNAVIFEELTNGPIVYDMKDVEERWEILKRCIMNYNDQETQDMIRLMSLLYGADWETKLALANGMLKVFFGDVGSVDAQRLKEKMEENEILREVIIAVETEFALKLLFGDRILIVNSESHLPTDSRLINEAGCLTVGDDKGLVKNWLVTQVTATYPKSDAARNCYEKPLQIEKVAEGVSLSTDFNKSVNARTDNWIANIVTLAYDPSLCSELMPLDKDPPLFVLIGGATHMPRLVQKLKGQFSIISVRPRKLEERMQKILR